MSISRWMDKKAVVHIYTMEYWAAAKSLQSCPTLSDSIDNSPPGSPIPGILQARTLEWVAVSFSNAWKWKVKTESEVSQSCPTLSDPMDYSLPGSSIHGIFRARVLEWGAIAFSDYSAIKKNIFESVLMRWMKLEPIIQSEVSQKEKHQYSILTHIYEI